MPIQHGQVKRFAVSRDYPEQSSCLDSESLAVTLNALFSSFKLAVCFATGLVCDM